MPANAPGSPAIDAVDQHAGEHPAPKSAAPVAPVAVAAVEEVRDLLGRLESLQHLISVKTVRRMRINVTKNTKGYSYDRTVEITTNDPDLELSEVISEELRLADSTARDEIEQCEYIDANGRPGADDLSTGNLF